MTSTDQIWWHWIAVFSAQIFIKLSLFDLYWRGRALLLCSMIYPSYLYIYSMFIIHDECNLWNDIIVSIAEYIWFKWLLERHHWHCQLLSWFNHNIFCWKRIWTDTTTKTNFHQRKCYFNENKINSDKMKIVAVTVCWSNDKLNSSEFSTIFDIFNRIHVLQLYVTLPQLQFTIYIFQHSKNVHHPWRKRLYHSLWG